MRANILHICKVYLPVRGGVQKVVHSIAGLTNQHNHHILTSGEDGAIRHQEFDGSLVTRCRSYMEIASMPIAPTLIRETRKQAKENHIICVHYPFPLADLALAATIKVPPIIVYWHSNIVVQKKLKWLTYPLIYFTLYRATNIIATSERMVENSKLLNRFREKVKIIPYGIPAIKPSLRVNTPHKKYFVLVGRHVSYKGIDIAIRAIKKIDTHLVIAGDGPLFEQHRLLAKTLKVSDKITFEKNASDDQIASFINESIALIVPSVMHSEAFALVQLEAMRLKKPVINTALPSSVPMIARNQQEGLTVDPKDPSALAKAMDRISKDEKLAIALGNNGYQRFNDHFIDHKFKQALGALFEEVLTSIA